VVTMMKVHRISPSGERQPSHKPAKASARLRRQTICPFLVPSWRSVVPCVANEVLKYSPIDQD
jgi:hypothetical protein